MWIHIQAVLVFDGLLISISLFPFPSLLVLVILISRSCCSYTSLPCDGQWQQVEDNSEQKRCPLS